MLSSEALTMHSILISKISRMTAVLWQLPIVLYLRSDGNFVANGLKILRRGVCDLHFVLARVHDQLTSNVYLLQQMSLCIE